MAVAEGTSAMREASRIALTYALAAIGWIYVSDRLADRLTLSESAYVWLQTAKGSLFVAVTAGILFVLLKRMFTAMERSRDDLYLAQFVIDHAADPVFWLRPDGGVAYVNEAACESLGYSRPELLAKTLPEIDPNYSSERWQQVWNALHHFGVLRLETTHRSKTGVEIPMEVTANLVNYKGRSLSIAFTRNIEERKAAEKRIRETQARLTTFIDVLPGYVFMKDAGGRYVLMNRRLREDFGLADSDVDARSHDDLFEPEVARRLSEEDRAVLQRGESLHIREEVVRIGSVLRALTVRKVPLRDETGAVVGLVGLALDISDRKEMEESLHKTNAALRRANTELEQFAYAAAHDLREPLRTIALYTQMLERAHAGHTDESAARAMQYILGSTRRMETLVHDLLEFTQALERVPDAVTDANEAAREAVDSLQAAIGSSGASVDVGWLPAVAVERSHLRQVLQNLIANAIRYRKPGMPPDIAVTAERGDTEAVFSVRDSGIGIKPEYHEQIFGLFKRLHGLDVPGNGIGLALCRKTVEHYGGRMWVDSAPGQGATFSFTLPLASADGDRNPGS